jgi:hypothetical protein
VRVAAAFRKGFDAAADLSNEQTLMTKSMDSRRRWLALVVLCMGDLMIVLDSTIVNVALPSIRVDLGFSETALV